MCGRNKRIRQSIRNEPSKTNGIKFHAEIHNLIPSIIPGELTRKESCDAARTLAHSRKKSLKVEILKAVVKIAISKEVRIGS